jgi:hypothetical protein
VDVGSLSGKDLKHLKLEQTKLKLQNFFFSTILRRTPDPARIAELQTINHLVRIREAVAQGDLDGKSPKELGELLHSLVAIEAKEPRAQLGLTIKGLGFVLSGMPPKKQAAVFKSFFSQGNEHSPEEVDSLKAAMGQPSLDGIVDEAAGKASSTERPEGELAATSSSAVLDPEAQEEPSPEEDLKRIRQVVSEAAKPDLTLLEQATAAKHLQDLRLTSAAGRKERERFWESGQALYPPTIVTNLGRKVNASRMQGPEQLKELYDEIEQIEKLGLALGESDKQRLKKCKDMVTELFVQKSVQFLAANVNRKSMPPDEQSRFDRLAGMLESVEKQPNFKEILSPLSETRQRYREYVQQRKAAKKA